MTNSIEECEALDGSFFFDINSLYVYINLDSGDSLNSYITGGILQGFSKYESEYINDRYYDSRVLSIPQIKKKRGSWNYDVLQNFGGTVRLANNDGFFDNWKDSIPLGTCFVRFGDDDVEYSQMQTRKFIIDSVSLHENDVVLRVNDYRKSISGTLLTETFEFSEYADLNDFYQGYWKPISWGDCRSCPTVPTNDNIVQTNYDFYVSKGSTTQAVYKNGKSVSFTVITDGFRLSNTVYDPEEADEITADITSSTKNAILVLLDLIENYAEININDIDVTGFNSLINFTYDLAIFITDQESVETLVANILKSIASYIYIDNNGLIAIRSDIVVKPINRTYFNEDIFNDLSFELSKKDVRSSITVGYDQGFSSGRFRRSVNTTEKDVVKQNFGLLNDEEILTSIKNKTDSDTLGALYQEKYKDINIFTFVELPSSANDLEFL
jgi:hypothetical protein